MSHHMELSLVNTEQASGCRDACALKIYWRLSRRFTSFMWYTSCFNHISAGWRSSRKQKSTKSGWIWTSASHGNATRSLSQYCCSGFPFKSSNKYATRQLSGAFRPFGIRTVFFTSHMVENDVPHFGVCR